MFYSLSVEFTNSIGLSFCFSVLNVYYFIYLFENVFAFKEATVALLKKVCQEKKTKGSFEKGFKRMRFHFRV